jgi:CTP:phosphocholine cytidylyltransferase-like protein
MNDQLEAIHDSHLNGQHKQMAEQIDDYNEMYSVFSDLREYLQSLYVRDADNILAEIVIKYHRIKYR